MVRVEIRPSGGYEYAVVVDDIQEESGKWKKKVIRSFGNANKGDNLLNAQKFAAAINAGRSFIGAEFEVNKEGLKDALTILAGATIAVAAVTWLMRE